MVAKQDTATPGQLVGGKISAASLGFEKASILKLVLADQEAAHFLFRVIGEATDTAKYETTIGGEVQEGFGLLGQFEATTRDGEVTDGTTLYLPKVAQNLGVAAVNSGNNARMALDIYARYDKDSATSYVYEVRSLIEPDRSAIDAIKQQLGNTALPRLPAK